MRIKIIITVAVLLLVSSHAGGQSLNGKQSLSEIEWNSRTITEGVV